MHAPAGALSDDACFRSGIISVALGDARRAATTFDELATRFPNSPELLAASYWAGRAWARVGNVSLARERWRAVVAREPNSYYGAASAKRLGTAPFSPAAADIPRSPGFQAKLARAAVLEQLGMDTEERYEYDAIEKAAAAAPATALAAGAALIDRGQAPRGIRLGWRAINAAREAGRVDQRGYTIAYPLLRRDALTIPRSSPRSFVRSRAGILAPSRARARAAGCRCCRASVRRSRARDAIPCGIPRCSSIPTSASRWERRIFAARCRTTTACPAHWRHTTPANRVCVAGHSVPAPAIPSCL